MRDEIIKGMVIGLVCVVIVVSIGSLIGQALSHGPEPQGDAAAESAEGAPAEGTGTLEDKIVEDAPEAGDTTGGKTVAE